MDNMGLVLDEIGRDMKACTCGDDGGDDQHVAESPDERSVAVGVQDRR